MPPPMDTIFVFFYLRINKGIFVTNVVAVQIVSQCPNKIIAILHFFLDIHNSIII